MFALGKQQRRGRVAKGMKGDRGQSSSLEKRPVHIREKVVRLHGPSDRVGKHQPEVLPQIAGRAALLILAYLMAPKRRHRRGRQHYLAPGCCGLWSAKGEPFPGPTKRAADLKHALVEVDVVPAHGEQLAAAHAGLERQDEQGFKAIASRGRQERSGLLDGEGDDLDVCLAWWPEERHDISWHQAPIARPRRRRRATRCAGG
jgi:hypothetical protein